MDIVSRIKKFMYSAQVSSSQLADTCKIPRPTISQILNGRNKKISNDLIAKIHAAYPGLSMSWLMFGEGSMMLDANIKISDTLNPDLSNNIMAQQAIDESIAPTFDFGEKVPQKSSENSAKASTSQNTVLTMAMGQNKANLSPNISSGRQIAYVMVFYDDNSVEKFTLASN